MNNLNHIAIICDGNRTWARLLDKNPFFGHTQGAKNIKNIVKATIKNNISYLTLFLLSTENLLNRSKDELDHLFSLFSKLIDYKSLFIENQIKFETVGDISKLPDNIIQSIKELKKTTKDFTQLNLTFAVNYGGRDEILRAANKFKDSDNLEFEECLDSSFLPDIDLMIRTGGFQRISNFLLWKLAYAEIFFTPKRWPEFTPDDFESILEDYQNIERKFGK